MKRIWASLFLFGLIGCDVSDSARVDENSSGGWSDVTYQQLPENAVLIDVDGVKMTKGDLERQVEMHTALYQARRGASKRLKEKTIVSIRMAAFARFEPFALVLRQAGKDGLSVSEPELQEAKKKYAKVFRKSFDRLVDMPMVKPFRNDMIQRLTEDLVVEKYLQINYSNELTVSEAMVSNRLAHVARYNAMAQATNNLVYARATNVWNLVKSGSDFAVMADRYSEDPEKAEGGVLGECCKEDFAEIPEYWDVVGKLKPGEISPVLRTDVGLEIVKCLKIVPAAESQTTSEMHLLARIFFNLANFYRDYTPQEVFKVLARHNREGVTASVIKKLGARYKVVYPYGKDVLKRGHDSRRVGLPVGP